MTPARLAVALALVALVVGVAACGSSGNGGSGGGYGAPSSQPATTSPAGGAAKGLLGVTKRADGRQQVTYAGHPLYAYAGDSAAGQTGGQGLDQFGAEWFVVSPRGTEVESQGS